MWFALINTIYKKILTTILFIIVIISLFACSEKDPYEDYESEDIMMSIDDFDIIYKDGTPIEVEVKDNKIYYDTFLIYEQKKDYAHDGFLYKNIFDKDYLIFNDSFDFDEDYRKKMLRGKSRVLINAFDEIDSIPWSERDNLDMELVDILHNGELYLVSATNDVDIKVLDYDNLYKYCKKNFDGLWVNVGGVTYKDRDIIKEIYDEIKENVDKYDEIIYEHFAIPDGNDKDTYHNFFGPNNYTIINGFRVQGEKGVEYMDSLSDSDKEQYMMIEKKVFIKNNPDVNFIPDLTYPMTMYDKGDFLSDGMPAYVSRDLNELATDVYGHKLYANVSKTFEEFMPYCDGTTYAFLGWVDEKVKSDDEYYNDVLLGKDIWDDKNFVDLEVSYHGQKNDEPDYYANYLKELEEKEKEKDMDNESNTLEIAILKEKSSEYDRRDATYEEKYNAELSRHKRYEK